MAEVEDLDPLRDFAEIIGKGVEEVQKGGIIGEGVENRAADEVAVGELGDLKGTDGRELLTGSDFGDEFLIGFKVIR